MEGFLELSDDQLLEEIGRSLPSESLGMFPLPVSKDEAKKRAVEWFSTQRATLQTVICEDQRIRGIERSAEAELLFHLVCEILTAAISGIPVGAVAAYLVKKGLRTLCAGQKLG